MLWQIYGVWAAVIVSLLGLGLVVLKTEPQIVSPQVKALFFIALFILIWSALTIIIFSIKNRLVRSRALSESAHDPIFYDSFFRGLLTATVLIAALLIKKFF
jgi:hypothetical protein